jgi:hypothetical protein
MQYQASPVKRPAGLVTTYGGEKMKWWESDLSGVKVGDKIFTSRFGWREVTSITGYLYAFPIVVQSPNGPVSFTLEGLFASTDKYPSAWPQCPFPEQPPHRPNFEIDHPVLVWGHGINSQHAKKRHFAEWPTSESDSAIFAWKNGRTSFSVALGGRKRWPYWKDAKDSEDADK